MSPLDRLLGSLGPLFEPPVVLLAASWSLFEPPGAVLAAPWSLLRHSWGALGATWAPLGSSWSRSKTTLKHHAKTDQLPDVKKVNLARLWRPILEPKIDQNGTQNESKIKTIVKSEKVALQELLGAALGRSRGILEAILASKFALR